MILLRQAAFVFILSDCPHVLLLVAVRLRQKKIASLEEEVECINAMNATHGGWGRGGLEYSHASSQNEEIWKWKSTPGKCEKKGKKNDCPVFKAKWGLIIDKSLPASEYLWRPSFQHVSFALMQENTYAEAFACRPALQIMLTNTLLFKVKISVFKKVNWNSTVHKHPWAPSPEAGCQWLLQTDSPLPIQEFSPLKT